MSPALQIDANSADAMAPLHEDALVLQPGAISVTGYAEELPMDPAEQGSRRRMPFQLHIAEDLVTHVVHVRRNVLQAAQQYSLALLQKVNLVELTGTGKRYRIRHFTDDPATGATVDFYGVLAG